MVCVSRHTLSLSLSLDDDYDDDDDYHQATSKTIGPIFMIEVSYERQFKIHTYHNILKMVTRSVRARASSIPLPKIQLCQSFLTGIALITLPLPRDGAAFSR